MRVSPLRRPEKPPTRSKRVALVTLIVAVPRWLSRRRNVRALRLTDTIVPSNWRVAACVAAAGAVAGGAGGAAADVAPTAASDAATTAIFLILMTPSLGARFRCEIRMRSGRATAGKPRSRTRQAPG